MNGQRPTWDDLVSGYVQRPKRPTPRHHRDNHRWAGLRQDSTQTLATAIQTARGALHAALHGSGTPAGGLALHAALQRPNERAS